MSKERALSSVQGIEEAMFDGEWTVRGTGSRSEVSGWQLVCCCPALMCVISNKKAVLRPSTRCGELGQNPLRAGPVLVCTYRFDMAQVDETLLDLPIDVPLRRI